MNPVKIVRFECCKCRKSYVLEHEARECCTTRIILNEGLFVTFDPTARLSGVAFMNSADVLKDTKGNPHEYFQISADCMDRLAKNWLRERS